MAIDGYCSALSILLCYGAGLDPVLDPDSLHPPELPRIVGDDDQSLAAGMAADLHVVRAAGRSRALKLGPELAVMRRRFRVERQHVESGDEIRDGCQIVGAARRLLRAVVQFPERDAGDAELFGQRIELLPQILRIVLHHVDADIGVEHVSEHQSGSRSSAGGCCRSTMKSSLARGPL